MSTRSVVRIQDGKSFINIYHHWDGYPEGVGLDIVKKFNAFKDNKIIVKGWNADILANTLIKDTEDDGYEATAYIHSDIDFLYVVDLVEHTIKCYQVQEAFEKYEDIVNGKGTLVDLAKIIKGINDELSEETKL